MSAKSRREQIEELLAEDPSDSFLRYGLAMEYIGTGEEEKAIACFRELVQRDPEYVAGFQQLGQTLIRLGRTDEARQALAQGIAAARRRGDAHAAEEMTGFIAALPTD